MMLLIALAIIVAFIASAATTLGFFDFEFWWELALLVTIMLLGHWQEMRAVGQAQDMLGALAALLPDDAERIVQGGLKTIPLAAGALAPIGVVLPPSIGALMMSVLTIIVALNAQLLRRLDLRPQPA